MTSQGLPRTGAIVELGLESTKVWSWLQGHSVDPRVEISGSSLQKLQDLLLKLMSDLGTPLFRILQGLPILVKDKIFSMTHRPSVIPLLPLGHSALP